MEINRGLEIIPLHVSELNLSLSLMLMFVCLKRKKDYMDLKNIFRICLPELRKPLK